MVSPSAPQHSGMRAHMLVTRLKRKEEMSSYTPETKERGGSQLPGVIGLYCAYMLQTALYPTKLHKCYMLIKTFYIKYF